MRPGPAPRDIVLLGAGHAHVEVLRHLARRPLAGARLTLVTREARTPYSGMLPGVIRGDYTASEAYIDCTSLAARAGVPIITACADAIDLGARRIAVAGHPPVAFDLLAIDVGGEARMPAGAGDAVKPIGQLLARLDGLLGELRPHARVAVVGGGPAGCELALALAVRRPDLSVALVSAATGILTDAPARARALVSAALARARVEVVAGQPAIGFGGGRLLLRDGATLAADAALWATGVAAPAFLARSGLACDRDGCVRVGANLRSVSHDGVFAAGDCAAFEDDPRPKAGVWAVRAGAPLARNLRRAAQGRPLSAWRPQRTALVMLGLGHGRAVAWRGQFTFAGRLAWWWKDRIDRRWIDTYP